MTAPSAKPSPADVDAINYYDQGEWWKSQAGWIRIADMTADHRRHAAAFMKRTAAGREDRLAWAEHAILTDAPDEVVDSFMTEQDRRADDPEAWIVGTALYRALLADLPKADGAIPDELFVRMGLS